MKKLFTSSTNFLVLAAFLVSTSGAAFAAQLDSQTVQSVAVLPSSILVKINAGKLTLCPSTPDRIQTAMLTVLLNAQTQKTKVMVSTVKNRLGIGTADCIEAVVQR